MSYWMLIGIVALYAFTAAVCAAIAVRIQSRRYAGDFFGYFLVGLLGAWAGGALWGAAGWLFSGVSVAAAFVGAALVVDINFLISEAIEHRSQAETKRSTKGLKARQFEDLAHGPQ